jgi:hypothetical protein
MTFQTSVVVRYMARERRTSWCWRPSGMAPCVKTKKATAITRRSRLELDTLVACRAMSWPRNLVGGRERTG